MKKLVIHKEVSYILSVVLMGFAVAMVTASDIGISMIVAPAYLLSLFADVKWLTFGRAEYIVQGILFIIFCIVMKKVKPVYFVAFLTCVIYGAVLDFWRLVIPMFNPNVYAPGSMGLGLRIVFFVVGDILTMLAVAFAFKSYLYPQVADIFVQGITTKYSLSQSKFKLIYDVSFLAISVIMSFCFFGKLVGISYGTIIIAFVNGPMLGVILKIFDKTCEFPTLFKKLEPLFKFETIEKKESE